MIFILNKHINYYNNQNINKMEKYEEKDNLNEIKAILVGNSGVGKTNLLNTCVGKPFDPSSTLTMSGTFVPKKIYVNNQEYIINLWDTAGQEIYQSINKMFYRGAEIVIFVFDISDKKSFNDLEHWINNVKEIIGFDFVAGIVGNKNDLFLSAQVKENEIKEYSQKKGLQYRLVSAKTNPEGLGEFLEYLITKPISENKLKDDNNNKNNSYKKNKQDNNLLLINKKRGKSMKLNHVKKEKKIKNCC